MNLDVVFLSASRDGHFCLGGSAAEQQPRRAAPEADVESGVPVDRSSHVTAIHDLRITL